MPLKLYGSPPTRVLRVMWMMNELGLEYELVPISPAAGGTRTPEYLRLNPAAKVPVLVDGDLVLTESAAIVLYLAEKYPEKGLLPKDLAQRAEVYRWILFAMTELEQPLWRIARHSFIYPEDKRLPAEIELARRDFVAMAKLLDAHLAGREYIAGDRMSAADCVTAYLMDWANELDLLEGLPNLVAYLDRMYARPTAPPRIAAVRKSQP